DDGARGIAAAGLPDQVDLRQKAEIAPHPQLGIAAHVAGAADEEVAEAVEDQLAVVHLDAAHDVGVMADDDIDPLLPGRPPPLLELLGVGPVAPLLAVMDREQLEVGLRLADLVGDLLPVVSEAIAERA